MANKAKSKIAFLLELTEDEAVALSLLHHSSSHGGGFVRKNVQSIVEAIDGADPRLPSKQFDKWEALGRPHYGIGVDKVYAEPNQ